MRLRWYGQALIWVGLFAFWVWLTRGHHPTLAIAFLATSLLLLASAAAVYLNHLLLIPRFSSHRLRYTLALMASIAGVALATVFAIQVAYDALWGPDPLRYGFAFNFFSEVVFITLHVGGAALLVWMLRKRSR